MIFISNDAENFKDSRDNFNLVKNISKVAAECGFEPMVAVIQNKIKNSLFMNQQSPSYLKYFIDSDHLSYSSQNIVDNAILHGIARDLRKNGWELIISS
jgi:hypothetical protein